MPETTSPPLDGTIPLGEIAQDLTVSLDTVQAMARTGELPAFKVGNRWRVGRAAYMAWKAERTQSAARRQRYLQGL